MLVEEKVRISRLHYITQDVDGQSHCHLIEQACAGGVDWVQLRVKDKPYEEWLGIAKEAKRICDTYKAKLIINDSVEIAKEVNASGVHLGRHDVSLIEARKILGSECIIGGTANSLEELQQLLYMPVDYIGLGPFRFTTTKKNLSPVLGSAGIKQIIETTGVTIPIIAIGGILSADIEEIINTGAHGVAVSSAINLADNKEEQIRAFWNALNK